MLSRAAQKNQLCFFAFWGVNYCSQTLESEFECEILNLNVKLSLRDINQFIWEGVP